MNFCSQCKKLSRYVWLSKNGLCYNCDSTISFIHIPLIFRSMESDKQSNNYTWEEWRGITKKVSKIEFGCRFNNEGCIKRQNLANKIGCCSGCPSNLGYIISLPKEAIDFVIENFKEKLGFWRPNKGCVLSWEYRSPICVCYRCPNIRINENKDLWPKFYKAVGLGERKYLWILNKMPKEKRCH